MSLPPEPAADFAEGIPNIEQADAWNGDDGRHWVAHRQRYDGMLRRLTPHLLEAAAVSTGDRVLDIGCGSGETTCAAARAAAEGTVVGIDLSGPMLDQARRRAEREGLENVHVEQGDAQVHRFAAASYDVAMSRFGVMFFADPAAAFANIVRAVRPGGRLALLCWQEARHNEWFMTMAGVLAEHVDPPATGANGPGPFALADPHRLRELVEGAGFADVSVTPVAEPMVLGSDIDDVMDFVRDVGPVRALLADAEEATAQRALDAVRAALASHQAAEGIQLGGAAWLVTASRAR